jgi:hypothetical protein
VRDWWWFCFLRQIWFCFWFTLLHGDGDGSEMVVMRSVVVATDLKWGGGGGDIYELGMLVSVGIRCSGDSFRGVILLRRRF